MVTDRLKRRITAAVEPPIRTAVLLSIGAAVLALIALLVALGGRHGA